MTILSFVEPAEEAISSAGDSDFRLIIYELGRAGTTDRGLGRSKEPETVQDKTL